MLPIYSLEHAALDMQESLRSTSAGHEEIQSRDMVTKPASTSQANHRNLMRCSNFRFSFVPRQATLDLCIAASSYHGTAIAFPLCQAGFNMLWLTELGPLREWIASPEIAYVMSCYE